MVHFFPSLFEVFINVYVTYINRWAYGILLWEIFTIGVYIISTLDFGNISTVRFASLLSWCSIRSWQESDHHSMFHSTAIQRGYK